MLGNTKGKMINQYVPDYVLYDLETTGTSSKYDEVVEISAVKVKNGVVTEEFSQLVNQTLTNDYIDTLKLARLCLPELSHHRLGDLAQYYGISTAGAHRALNDCRMNQQIFEKLAKELDGTTGRNIEIKNCPVCGQPLKKRNGRFGEFWGCMGFPTCRYTENI